MARPRVSHGDGSHVWRAGGNNILNKQSLTANRVGGLGGGLKKLKKNSLLRNVTEGFGNVLFWISVGCCDQFNELSSSVKGGNFLSI